MTKSSPAGTRVIGIRPATNLFHSARFATELGRPPTVAVSINWDRLGVDEDHASALFRGLRARVRRSWKHLVSTDRAARQFDDWAVQENPDGHRNTHWTVNVAQDQVRTFERLVTKFLKKLLELDEIGAGLHFRRVRPDAIGGHMKYLAKGLLPAAGTYFHVVPIDQGWVSGHGRTLVSRSLGFKARKAAGWVRKRRPRGDMMAMSKPKK